MEQFNLKEEGDMGWGDLIQGKDLFFAICKGRTKTKGRFGEQQVLPKYGEITF